LGNYVPLVLKSLLRCSVGTKIIPLNIGYNTCYEVIERIISILDLFTYL
jgi:hypothetical protein